MLVVVSKTRKLVKEKAELSTSLDVFDSLTVHLEDVVLAAASLAKADGRKTLMQRDIQQILRRGENNEPVYRG